jgi:hypothetical protein
MHKPQWIFARNIQTLIEALLSNDIRHGTVSWDATMMKSCSLLLQAVLSAGAEGIHRSPFYEGLQCMLWEHITVASRTRDSDGRDFFIATVKMHYSEGFE